MNKPLPPYTCTCSPNIPELLLGLNISLILSTYQAGKVIFLSAAEDDKLIQLPRNFDTPMGIALAGNKLAIASKNEITVLCNSPEMAANYPAKPNTYDAIFLLRASYYTGHLSLHDMYYVDNKIMATNTLFSCISMIDNEYSFTPIWKPTFIKEYSPDDFCNLNGLAIDKTGPRYATALGGKSNERQGWGENKMTGGVLIDINSDEIILENLQMPHSPRIYNDKLYFLNSAAGELCAVDTEKGTYGVIANLGGYERGMDKYEDYLFIGVSKLRHQSKVFGDLPIAKSSFAGIVIVYLPTGSIVGHIRYETSVEEIYDVKVLPGYLRPGIVSMEKEAGRSAITSPVGDFWAAEDN